MEKYFVAAAILCFLVIVFVKARKGILEMLDSRIESIRAELDDARKLHEDARALLAEYEKKRNNAETEAKEMVDFAKAEADRLIEQTSADLEAQLERRTATARDRIAQAEAQAIQDVRAAAVDVAVTAAETLIRDGLDASKQADLAKSSIQDATKKLH